MAGGGGGGGERNGRRGDTKAASQIAHSSRDAVCMDEAVANVSGQSLDTSSSFTPAHCVIKSRKSILSNINEQAT